MGKYIKHAELREITDSYKKEEISYSRMVEMINEVVESKIKNNLFKKEDCYIFKKVGCHCVNKCEYKDLMS